MKLESIEGKVVESAEVGKDDHGYDLLRILFTDKTSMTVHEEGQAGEFSVFVSSEDK